MENNENLDAHGEALLQQYRELYPKLDDLAKEAYDQLRRALREQGIYERHGEVENPLISTCNLVFWTCNLVFWTYNLVCSTFKVVWAIAALHFFSYFCNIVIN